MGDYEVLRTVWAYDLSDPDTGDDWELRHRCRGFWKGEADRVKDGQWIAGTDSDHAGAVWKMYVGSEHVNTVKVDEIPPPERESTDNIRLSIYTADESVKLAAVTQKPSWTSVLQGTTGLTDPNPLYVYVDEKVVATLGKEAMVNTDGFNWPNWKLIADGTNTLKGAGISPLVPVLIAGKLSFGSVFRGDDSSQVHLHRFCCIRSAFTLCRLLRFVRNMFRRQGWQLKVNWHLFSSCDLFFDWQ